MNENTAMLLAFIPVTFGSLMIMGGDFASKILGGVCCMSGLAVIAVHLNNEHQEYLKLKQEKEATAAHKEQMEYIERLGASQEKRD